MGIFDGCLLASDIDGTLLDNGYINPRCIEKIKFFASEGGAFAISTGRSVGAVSMVTNAIDCLAPSVVANGAMIYDYKNRKIIKEHLLPNDDKRIVNAVMELGLDIGVEIHSGERALVVRANCETDDHEQYEDLVAEFVSLDEALKHNWTKVLFAFANPDDLEGVKEFILGLNIKSDLFNTVAYIDNRQRYYLEVVPKGVSKAGSVKDLCGILGIADGCCYAIGDYYNDVQMLRSADVTAAPINSPDDIKALVDVVVSKAKDGAVADFIDYLTGRKTKNGCD